LARPTQHPNYHRSPRQILRRCLADALGLDSGSVRQSVLHYDTEVRDRPIAAAAAPVPACSGAIAKGQWTGHRIKTPVRSSWCVRFWRSQEASEVFPFFRACRLRNTYEQRFWLGPAQDCRDSATSFDDAFRVDELCRKVYGEYWVEKKQRVSVVRAAKALVRKRPDLDWTGSGGPGKGLVFFIRGSAMSYAGQCSISGFARKSSSSASPAGRMVT